MTNYDDVCGHFSRYQDDNSGDELCTSCGLVLGRLLHYPPGTIGGDENIDDKLFRAGKWNAKAYFYDACMNECLTTQTAIDSYRYYKKMRRHSSSKGFPNIEVAAYALYACAAEAGAGRSPHHIARISGISVKKSGRLSDLQKIFPHPNASIFDDAKNYISNLCYYLHLTGRDKMTLHRWVDDYHLEGCRPQTLAAALAYIYCQSCNVVMRRSNATRAAQAAGVSVDSLRRAVKKLTVMYPDIFKT
jgi:transcription initiation factor TFIIIB Brf1 subunit/transcription initiation factor TFIIB